MISQTFLAGGTSVAQHGRTIWRSDFEMRGARGCLHDQD